MSFLVILLLYHPSPITKPTCANKLSSVSHPLIQSSISCPTSKWWNSLSYRVSSPALFQEIWDVSLQSHLTPVARLRNLLICCRYSVFGLGSSSYPNYCAFAKQVDYQMLELGFEQLLPLQTGDATKNQDSAFRCNRNDNQKHMAS